MGIGSTMRMGYQEEDEEAYKKKKMKMMKMKMKMMKKNKFACYRVVSSTPLKSSLIDLCLRHRYKGFISEQEQSTRAKYKRMGPCLDKGSNCCY